MRKFNVHASKVKLHNLWSLYVRTRDGFRCQWCGRYEKPGNAHHIVAKSICQNAGRFEVENGMHLCVNCHMNRVPTEHDEYIAFRDKWLADRGIVYSELRAKYNASVKFDKDLYDLKTKVTTDMLTEALRSMGL